MRLFLAGLKRSIMAMQKSKAPPAIIKSAIVMLSSLKMALPKKTNPIARQRAVITDFIITLNLSFFFPPALATGHVPGHRAFHVFYACSGYLPVAVRTQGIPSPDQAVKIGFFHANFTFSFFVTRTVCAVLVRSFSTVLYAK